MILITDINLNWVVFDEEFHRTTTSGGSSDLCFLIGPFRSLSRAVLEAREVASGEMKGSELLIITRL